MKKLIGFFVLLYALECEAQKNIFSIVFQPIDMGIGAKYERKFNHAGYYVSASDGVYHMLNGTVHNYRLSGGLSIQLTPAIKSNPSVMCGFVYHRYFGLDRLWNIEKKTWRQFSFEVGIQNKIKWVNIAVRYDFMKNESCIDLGVRF